MKHIIIGIRGQIGTCVKEFLTLVGEERMIGLDMVEGRDVVVYGGEGGEDGGMGSYRGGETMMHVCIPFVGEDRFRNVVKNYMSRYVPKYVVVYSTVLPGTCIRLGKNAVHSPVEGRHPNLLEGFKVFKRLVAGKCSMEVGRIFEGWGLEVQTYDDAVVTELGKLLSTTRYGINLLFCAAEESMCKKAGVEFEKVVLDYQRMYNEGYRKLGQDKFIQPLLTAPDGKIGGHCVVPNANLLSMFTSDEWVKKLAKFNEQG